MTLSCQVCSVTVIHVPDDKHNLSARILFQYLLTSQGNMYELKVLHVSLHLTLIGLLDYVVVI